MRQVAVSGLPVRSSSARITVTERSAVLYEPVAGGGRCRHGCRQGEAAIGENRYMSRTFDGCARVAVGL